VLIGRHQLLRREIHLDYCKRQGIGLARRITGGGAIYFDEGQIGWELVFDRSATSTSLGGRKNLGELAQAICEGAAIGLRRLGADAHFRPRNDIEVAGRKLCGSGGFFDGDTVFYQGTLLIDSDPEHMLRALNVPRAKLQKRNLDSASERLITLQNILGDDMPSLTDIENALLQGFRERLGIEPQRGEITTVEETRAQHLFDEEIGTDDFVFELDQPMSGGAIYAGSATDAGGTVNATVRLEGHHEERIREVLFSGDFFVSPPRVVFDLEAALRGEATARSAERMTQFFATTPVETLSLSPRTFQAALDDALAQKP
jgi:lipoate-protein ligase A